MIYKFKYKRLLFWRTEIVIGHMYNSDQNKMTLFYQDGSLKEIKEWSKCEVYLDVDWVLAQKKNMEKQANQPITLEV